MTYSIVGLGVTDVGRVGGRGILEYEVEASRRAIADAGLSPSQIGAAIQMLSDPGGNIRTRQDDSFARVLGLPVNLYIENIGRGGEYVCTAMLLAMKALDFGLADYVVVSGARDDWTRSRKTKESGARGTGQLHVKKEGVWGYQNGVVSAASFHSLLASRHMSQFGTTHEQLGAVAVAQREWAHGNPSAQMAGKRLTIDEYIGAPYLVWPYRIFDCSVQSDGGVAFVLTTDERARDCASIPISVAGIGFGEQLAEMWWTKENYSALAVSNARDAAFRQANVTLDDIDVAQLYDCFTTEVVVQIEGYGWCEKGGGGAWSADGHSAPGGDMPINTGGGLLSGFHLGNLTGLAEAVIQLRGQGGGRQVDGAQTALVTGHGGEIISGQMCSIHSSLVLQGGAK